MSLEIDDDIKFETLLADKRHKELSGALRLISKALSEKSDSKVVDAIYEQAEKIEKLVKAIQEIPQPETPEVNVELNPKEFILATKQICDDIIESNNRVILSIENRLLPDTFELIKQYGVTMSVKVNYKPANKIQTKK